MRHLLVAAAFLGALVLATAVGGQLAQRGGSPLHAWVITRGPVGPAMTRAAAAADAQVLNTWFGGRLLLLQVAADARIPAGSAWLTLRMAPTTVGLAGCG